MSFIRAKEIPPGSGRWYDYEVEDYREGGRVKQRVIRYIGRSGGIGTTRGGSVATSGPTHLGTTGDIPMPTSGSKHSEPIGTTPINAWQMTYDAWIQAGAPGKNKGESSKIAYTRIILDAISEGQNIPLTVVKEKGWEIESGTDPGSAKPNPYKFASALAMRIPSLKETKARGENGELALVFHGAKGFLIDNTPAGRPIYFTDNQKTASWFQYLGKEGEKGERHVDVGFLQLKNPLVVKAPAGLEAGSTEGSTFINGLLKNTDRTKHDGIIIRDIYESGFRGDDYIIWDSRQFIPIEGVTGGTPK